jgi:hypothetical protein
MTNPTPFEFPFTATLLVEGEESTDRRKVAHGALMWETPILLYRLGFWTSGENEIVGTITEIHREDNLIRGSGMATEDITGKPLAAEIIIDEWETSGDDESFSDWTAVIRNGRLVRVALVPRPAFLAARVDGGDDG